MVVVGKGGCCLNRGLRCLRRWAMIFGVLWMVLVWGMWSTTASRSGKASRV